MQESCDAKGLYVAVSALNQVTVLIVSISRAYRHSSTEFTIISMSQPLSRKREKVPISFNLFALLAIAEYFEAKTT